MRTDRVVAITGAVGGMGKLAVERFPANGDSVIATDISDKRLAKLAEGAKPAAKLHTVVGTIFFLASPDAAFISGQTVNVDGGKHML